MDHNDQGKNNLGSVLKMGIGYDARMSVVLENQFEQLDTGNRRRGAVHKKAPGADEFHTSNATLKADSSLEAQLPIDYMQSESDINEFQRAKISVNNHHFDFKGGQTFTEDEDGVINFNFRPESTLIDSESETSGTPQVKLVEDIQFPDNPVIKDVEEVKEGYDTNSGSDDYMSSDEESQIEQNIVKDKNGKSMFGGGSILADIDHFKRFRGNQQYVNSMMDHTKPIKEEDEEVEEVQYNQSIAGGQVQLTRQRKRNCNPVQMQAQVQRMNTILMTSKKFKEFQKNRKYRFFIANEIKDTEIRYVRGLQCLQLIRKSFIQEKNGQSKIISNVELESMFGNIDEIVSMNLVFYNKIKQCVDDWDNTGHKTLPQVLMSISKFNDAYHKFYIHHTRANEMYTQLYEGRKPFKKHLDKFIKQNDMVSVDHYLITPCQRMPRYKILVQDLIKHSYIHSKQHKEYTEVYEAIKEILNSINSKMGDQERYKKPPMVLQKACHEKISLVNKLLVEIFDMGMIDPQIDKKTVMKVYLFTDLILVVEQDGKKSFTYKSHMRLNTYCRINSLSNLKYFHNLLQVTSDRECYIFRASTQTMKRLFYFTFKEMIANIEEEINQMTSQIEVDYDEEEYKVTDDNRGLSVAQRFQHLAAVGVKERTKTLNQNNFNEKIRLTHQISSQYEVNFEKWHVSIPITEWQGDSYIFKIKLKKISTNEKSKVYYKFNDLTFMAKQLIEMKKNGEQDLEDVDLPKFPDKKFFITGRTETTEFRKLALIQYIQRLLLIDSVAKLEIVHYFFKLGQYNYMNKVSSISRHEDPHKEPITFYLCDSRTITLYLELTTSCREVINEINEILNLQYVKDYRLFYYKRTKMKIMEQDEYPIKVLNNLKKSSTVRKFTVTKIKNISNEAIRWEDILRIKEEESNGIFLFKKCFFSPYDFNVNPNEETIESLRLKSTQVIAETILQQIKLSKADLAQFLGYALTIMNNRLKNEENNNNAVSPAKCQLDTKSSFSTQLGQIFHNPNFTESLTTTHLSHISKTIRKCNDLDEKQICSEFINIAAKQKLYGRHLFWVENFKENRGVDFPHNMWISVGPTSIDILDPIKKNELFSFSLRSVKIWFYPNAILMDIGDFRSTRFTCENSTDLERVVRKYQRDIGMKLN